MSDGGWYVHNPSFDKLWGETSDTINGCNIPDYRNRNDFT